MTRPEIIACILSLELQEARHHATRDGGSEGAAAHRGYEAALRDVRSLLTGMTQSTVARRRQVCVDVQARTQAQKS